jgi:hypothetical protein
MSASSAASTRSEIATQDGSLRIAYLTEWPPYSETGVLRKLIGQVRAWREHGCEAQLFALVPRRDAPTALDFDEHGVTIGAFPQRYLDRFPRARLGLFNKIASAPLVRRALRNYRPDVIYYRQNGPWYPGIGALLSIAPSVMEINTSERAETKLWGPAIGAAYRATQAWVWRHVSGFVCVTREIAGDFRAHNKPIAVFGNSFWGDVRNSAPTGNTKPAFVFIGSRIDVSANWHGVDKVFPLAAAMPDSAFHIVGMARDDFGDAAAPANVRFHGELRGAELNSVLASCDIGLGTLALHRKNMEEACPLKVREYLMNRLPVVIGYRETQAELRAAPYMLDIGNGRDNVANNIDRIRTFAAAWTNRRVTADLSFLSMESIESRRIAFLTEMADAEACMTAIKKTPN